MARGLDRPRRGISTARRLRELLGRDENGAALVEAAFVLTLLVMLLLGIVTAGIAYGQSNALQTAAREGARFAATLPDVGSNLGDVINVTEAAAIGDLDPGVPGRYICVALVGQAPQTVGTPSGPAPLADACFSDGRPSDEERVQVVVERTATINAVLFSTDITLRSEQAARYER